MQLSIHKGTISDLDRLNWAWSAASPTSDAFVQGMRAGRQELWSWKTELAS